MFYKNTNSDTEQCIGTVFELYMGFIVSSDSGCVVFTNKIFLIISYRDVEEKIKSYRHNGQYDDF